MIKKKIGEIKPCSQCGQDYEHYACNKYKACKECRNKIYLKRHRLKEEDKKKPYPLGLAERKRRYTRLRKELDGLESREEHTQYYDKIFIEIEELGLWKWCVDLRPAIKPKGIKEGKGRRKNSASNPLLKWPDTRYMNE